MKNEIQKAQKSIQRFAEKVEFSESCWIWTGGRNKNNYGVFRFNGSSGLAHRFSWTYFNGHIADGKYILHKCDNPPCVNPNHLFEGDQSDNMKDASEKKRLVHGDDHWTKKNPEKIKRGEDHWHRKNRHLVPKGEDSTSAKLTWNDVEEIRNSYIPRNRNFSQRALARKYNVTPSLIHYVLRQDIWKKNSLPKGGN